MIKIRTIPSNIPIQHRQFFEDLKQAVEELQGNHAPASAPSNLTITPLPGGHQITFTRGAAAASHTVYASSSPNFQQAQPKQIGLGNQYTDNVGVPSARRYYWVRSFDSAGRGSQLVGPVHGMTLPLTTAAILPKKLPQASAVQVTDAATGQAASGVQTNRGFKKF